MESLTASSQASADAILDEMVTALRHGDAARAQAAFDAAPNPPAPLAMTRLAELNMRRRRWGDAAWLLDRTPGRDAATELKRCLSRNLASLQRHRPGLYERLVNLALDGHCSIGPSATGRPTVVRRGQDGTFISLSPANDPLGGVASAMRSLRDHLDCGQAIALCGAGDGYLLQVLARDATPLMLGMQQPIFVLEADPQVLLHGLMLHDYTGPLGPIEQQRFFWFVGDNWAQELAAAGQSDPYLGCPVVAVPLGPDGPAMRAGLERSILALAERESHVTKRIDAYYASMPSPAELFTAHPPRMPRVLLLTTRFSSVLQYSTRDAADGFRQIGWDARVVIEPSPAHRLYRPALRRAIDEFQPDLVFQIDHLRHEHGNLFPPSLPFACWVQDHLPNLTDPAAGAAVGLRDFVLVGTPTMYVDRYGYPRRQCLPLTKLSRIPQRPSSWEADGEDLVYVSTASQLPGDVVRDMTSRYARSPEALDFMTECCRRMIDLYKAGRSLPTPMAVRLFVEEVEREAGLVLEEPAARRVLIDTLFDRLGNVLYRQQSLSWAAGIARRNGLRLGIYGPGWDHHPDFADFARGQVDYGPDLEALTRRSKINLVLEPFFCMSHQRLLDGLMAGGFFVIRDNPMNGLMQEMSQFLSRHVPGEAATVDAVRASLPGAKRAAFEDLLSRAGCIAEFGDAIQLVRDAREAGTLDAGPEPLPHLSRVSFNTAAEMEQSVVGFLADPATRQEISQAQRQRIEARLSYAAGLARNVAAIGKLIGSEPRAAQEHNIDREAA